MLKSAGSGSGGSVANLYPVTTQESNASITPTNETYPAASTPTLRQSAIRQLRSPQSARPTAAWCRYAGAHEESSNGEEKPRRRKPTVRAR
jgi:hypothetical protein